jgi:hypothetical protein
LIRGPSSLAPAALLATLLALASCGEPEPPPKPPLEAELIVPKPGPAGGRVQPKGLAAEASGYGTILSAPATEYEPPAPPDPISISTPPPPPGPAVAPEIAHLIRLLPRVRPQPVDDRNILRTLEAPPMSAARVILRNGCFRLRQPGEPLVLFTVGIRAFVDPQGYLAVGAALHPTGLSGRVGERLRWEGRVDPVAEPAITGPINRICGAGRVVRIGLASSEAAQLSIEDASTAREVASRYGTPIRRRAANSAPAEPNMIAAGRRSAPATAIVTRRSNSFPALHANPAAAGSEAGRLPERHNSSRRIVPRCERPRRSDSAAASHGVKPCA